MSKRASSPELPEVQSLYLSPAKRVKLDAVVQGANWCTTPPEIQLKIFEHMQYHPAAARVNYATVCRSWQYYFEDVNFQDLVLDNRRVRQLEHIVTKRPRRRGIVRTIWFRFELESYVCPLAREWRHSYKSNKDLFLVVFWDLLKTLSKWKDHPGLFLDIGVKPPAFRRHWKKAASIPTAYPNGVMGEIAGRKPRIERAAGDRFLCPHWSPSPRWRCSCPRVTGDPTMTASREAARLLYSDKTGPKWDKFYKVPAVRGVHFHQQYHRLVSGSTLQRLLGYTFESADCFAFEHTPAYRRDDLYALLEVIGHLRKSPPLTRDVQVFNDHNLSRITDIVTLTNHGAPWFLDMTPAKYLTVKQNMKRALEPYKLVGHTDYMRAKHLSSYWRCDAFDIFTAMKRYISNPEVKNPLHYLKSVCLTLPTLGYHCDAEQMGRGMASGLELIDQLPNLRRLDLWGYHGEDRARSFMFTWKYQPQRFETYFNLTIWLPTYDTPRLETVQPIIEAAELAVKLSHPTFSREFSLFKNFVHEGKEHLIPVLGYPIVVDSPDDALRWRVDAEHVHYSE